MIIREVEEEERGEDGREERYERRMRVVSRIPFVRTASLYTAAIGFTNLAFRIRSSLSGTAG